MKEKLELPKVLSDLLAAQEKYDSAAFAECFANDAIVHDEDQDHRGKTEIKKWNEWTNKEYKTKLEATDFVVRGKESVLTTLASGTFPGSPVEIKYRFIIKDGKIESLRTN